MANDLISGSFKGGERSNSALRELSVAFERIRADRPLECSPFRAIIRSCSSCWRLSRVTPNVDPAKARAGSLNCRTYQSREAVDEHREAVQPEPAARSALCQPGRQRRLP